jgi:hypothetical protein
LTYWWPGSEQREAIEAFVGFSGCQMITLLEQLDLLPPSRVDIL